MTDYESVRSSEEKLLDAINQFLAETEDQSSSIVSAQIVVEVVNFADDCDHPHYKTIHALLNDASIAGMYGSIKIAYDRMGKWIASPEGPHGGED